MGAAEPEIQSWLRAAGHAPRAVRRADAAGAALEKEPVDLVIVDRDSSGLDAPAVCRTLRADPRLGDAWLLAITVAAKGRMADSVLDAGADDYLHRPFTRAELIARARAGLQAAEQRANDRLLRTLMENVPGAIYRSAWHADFVLEAISDEIERISGYAPTNFLASTKRTILSIVHPDDVDVVLETVAESTEHGEPFVLEYRIVRADGEVRWVLDRGQPVPGAGNRLWLDGALFDITERRAAEEALLAHKVEAARSAELRASRQRILEAADAARRKIERDLHDGAQQRLVSLVLDVQVARRRLAKDPSDVGPFLERLANELKEASTELRELARGIHPAVLTERGLVAAIGALATRCALPGRGPRAAVGALPARDRGHRLLHRGRGADERRQVRARPPTPWSGSRARGPTSSSRCRDDGIGGASIGSGSGLSGLADRVGASDGSLSVDSPLGQGTCVRAVLPLNGAG